MGVEQKKHISIDFLEKDVQQVQKQTTLHYEIRERDVNVFSITAFMILAQKYKT